VRWKPQLVRGRGVMLIWLNFQLFWWPDWRGWEFDGGQPGGCIFITAGRLQLVVMK
jgi:hypothetical protein